jgi:hypothetical protein
MLHNFASIILIIYGTASLMTDENSSQIVEVLMFLPLFL